MANTQGLLKEYKSELILSVLGVFTPLTILLLAWGELLSGKIIPTVVLGASIPITWIGGRQFVKFVQAITDQRA